MPIIGPPVPDAELVDPTLDVDSYPEVLREPVKRVWALLAVATAIASGIVVLAGNVAGFAPESWRPYIATGAGVATAATVIIGRAQAFLARNRVYPYAAAAELAKTAGPKFLPPPA